MSRCGKCDGLLFGGACPAPACNDTGWEVEEAYDEGRMDGYDEGYDDAVKDGGKQGARWSDRRLFDAE